MKNILHKRIKVFLAFLLVLSNPIVAQKNSDKGDKLFDKNLFNDAIPFYELEIKLKNNKTIDHALLKLADCYRITGEFEKAEATYKILLKKKKKDPKAIMNYALSLKSSAKYAEASVQFKEYLKLNPSDPMGEMLFQSCDLAQTWLEETIGKEVRNVEKINTPSSDFAPVFSSPNELVFTSSRFGSKQALISFDGGLEVHKLDLYDVDINSIARQYVDYKKALTYAQKAYDLNKLESPKENLAIAYYFNENYNQTISLLSSSNFIQHPYAAYWLGFAYSKIDDSYNAKIYLQKAIAGGVKVSQEVWDYINSH